MERKRVSVTLCFASVSHVLLWDRAWVSEVGIRQPTSGALTVFKAKEKRELYVKIKLTPHSKHFLHVISAEIFAVFLTPYKTN
jgi:LPS O-antigen subunit length determinant protein (WzzB/FepE family)